MISAVLITKSGSVNTINNIDITNIKASMKNKRTQNTKLLHIWDLGNNTFIKLNGYITGKERFINKHELLPPVDTNLYYGDLILYKVHGSQLINFSAIDYHQWYQTVYQIEDLDNTIIEDEYNMIDSGLDDNEYDYDDDFIVRD